MLRQGNAEDPHAEEDSGIAQLVAWGLPLREYGAAGVHSHEAPHTHRDNDGADDADLRKQRPSSKGQGRSTGDKGRKSRFRFLPRGIVGISSEVRNEG